MRIIGCDLHARQQTLAMLETTTGEVVNLTLMHEGNEVRDRLESRIQTPPLRPRLFSLLSSLWNKGVLFIPTL